MAKKVLLGILGLSLALAATAWAFNGDEAFQTQLQGIKRSQLGPALGADQRTVDQLLAIEQRYGAMKQQLTREAVEASRQLQQVMQNPQPREEDVRTLLETMVQKKKEIEAVRQRQWDEQKALLTPVQLARYFLYMQHMTREARSVRSPAAPAAPPRYPAGKAPEGVPVFRPNR
ncbi:MAG: hypothetical protein FJ126_12705 [Deltaproteobacteria bacterium]|nr:hypothetical protein [Deltaproteobacteria bacterium]